MKLVRFGAAGAERPGIVDPQGAVRDLSAHITDICGDTLDDATLDKLRKLDLKALPMAPHGVRLGPPVGNVRNFIAVGLNYADHAKEAGMAIPKEPILFNKLPNCIVGPSDDVMMPKGSAKLDYEIEIGFVIGKRARYVEEKNALAHVAGYCIGNDVSEREFQIERGGQWMKGKCAETFGPLGPWLVTRDEIADVQNLAMTLDVNGERRQTGNTNTMIFGIAHLLHYISQFMVLEAGDVQNLAMTLDVNGERRQTGNTNTMIFGIAHLLHYISQFMVLEAGDVVITGTPPGVALGMKPPGWLKPGDVMTLSIDGLGVQRSKVAPFKE